MRATSLSPRRRARLSQDRRDQIVREHVALVKAIAIRVHENLPLHVDLDDLIHAGVMGLFDAVIKCDNSKNVAFHAYAKHRIKGAILDSLRQLDWASRDLRKRQKQVESVTRDLAAKLGRTPHETEVASEMGLDMTRWRRVQMELQTAGPASATPKPDEPHELQTTLARAIEKLPQRHQKEDSFQRLPIYSSVAPFAMAKRR